MRCPANRAIRLLRMLSSLILYTVLPALLAVGSARAREGETVSRGARIRVFSTVLAARPVVGSLVNLEADTLVMTAGPDTHAVVLPLGTVSRFEISRGRQTHRGSYAGIGLLLGAGAGALIGAAIYTPHGSQGFFDIDLFDSRGSSAARGAVVGALIGTVGGVAVGSGGSERWIAVDPAAVRLTWQPAGRGATVSALIHF